MVQQLGTLVLLLQMIWGGDPSTFHGGSHVSNSVPGIAILSGLHRHQTHIWCTYMCKHSEYRQNIHIKIN